MLGLPRFSEVNPLPWGTPVQGLGFPDGPVPDDGERLYSHPRKENNFLSYPGTNWPSRAPEPLVGAPLPDA